MPEPEKGKAMPNEQCASYMASNPELVPGFVEVADLSKDRCLRLPLANVFRSLSELTEAVDDTLMVLSKRNPRPFLLPERPPGGQTRRARRRHRPGRAQPTLPRPPQSQGDHSSRQSLSKPIDLSGNLQNPDSQNPRENNLPPPRSRLFGLFST